MPELLDMLDCARGALLTVTTTKVKAAEFRPPSKHQSLQFVIFRFPGVKWYGGQGPLRDI